MHARNDPSVLELAGLESLERLRASSTKRVIRSIAVVAPELPTDAACRLERQLNRWYFACGCEQGSISVLVTLLACSTTGLVAGFDGPFEWWRIVGYVMAAALGGKALGMAYAKARLRGLYRRLETHYGCQKLKERLRTGSLPPNGSARLGRAPDEWDRLPNNSMQRTALRAAADAER